MSASEDGRKKTLLVQMTMMHVGIRSTVPHELERVEEEEQIAR
jgi:hypothetical protein